MNGAIKKKVAIGVCTVIIVSCILCICYLLLTISRNHVDKQDVLMCSVNFEASSGYSSSLDCNSEKISTGSCGNCPNRDGKCSPVIKVDVRAVGATIKVQACDDTLETNHCGSDTGNDAYHCINGDCAGLDGLFNCSTAKSSSTGQIESAVCRNITDLLECNVQNTESPIRCNTKRACLHLNGLYDCKFGECSRVPPPFSCKRKCTNTNVDNKNVIVIENREIIHTGKCGRAFRVDGKQIEVWNQRSDNRIFMIKCTQFESRDNTTFQFSDCYDSALVQQSLFGNSTNMSEVLGMFGSGDNQPIRFNKDLVISEASQFRVQEHGCVDHQECDVLFNNLVHRVFKCFASDEIDVFVQRLSRRSFLGRLIPFALIIFLSILCSFTVAVRKRILNDKPRWFHVCCFDQKRAESQL